MKPLLLFLLLLTHSLHGQALLMEVLPLSNAKVTFKKVHEVIGDTQPELCTKAINWFENEAIPIEINKPLDDTHHYLSGTYSFKTLWGPNDFPELYKEVRLTINLTIKNERYQYEISKFIVYEANQSTQLEIYKLEHKKLYKYNKAFYQRISIEINKLITSLVNTMDES